MDKPWDLRVRTMQFAVATHRFCRTIPKDPEAWDIVRQLRRAAASVAANYRALCRSHSDSAFVAKASTLIEEADESAFWFEFLVEVELVKDVSVTALRREANELVAIFVASKKTAMERCERERQRQRAER